MEHVHKCLGRLNMHDGAHTATAPLLEPGQIVRLRVNGGNYLRLNADQTVTIGSLGHMTHLRVSEAPNHAIRFESVVVPGIFLGINADKDVTFAGKGAEWCHLRATIVSRGRICLSRADGKGGHIGVDDSGNLKPPSKSQMGPHAQIVVEAILNPGMIGLLPGVEVRMHHVLAKGFLRIAPDHSIDGKGGDGSAPYFRVGIANGNVTFQSADTNLFLGVDAHHALVAAPQPGYFSVFFASDDTTVGIMSNMPPEHNTVGLRADGKPAPMRELKGPDSRFVLHAALDPVFFGIMPRHTHFSLRVPGKKYLRSTQDQKADFEGAPEGPRRWMMLHPHGKAPHAVNIVSVEGGFVFRSNGPAGVDFAAKADGPNAASHLYNLGGGKVALMLPGGFLNHDLTLSPRPTAKSELLLELK